MASSVAAAALKQAVAAAELLTRDNSSLREALADQQSSLQWKIAWLSSSLAEANTSLVKANAIIAALYMCILE